MANITITRGTTLPDSSAKSDFHGLVDNASIAISNIENADVSNSAAIAASKLNLATIAQDMAMSSKVINFAKGSDIASATTTDIGAATGNFVDVTGTTTITGLGTVQAGTIRFVRFTGILTLTHNGTSLILPTTANITTAANDRAIFASLGSGNWICLAYQKTDGTPLGSAYTPTASNALSGSVIQTQIGTIATVVNVSATAVFDDTIPLDGETTQICSVSITPTNTNNTIIVEAIASGSKDGSTGFLAWCIFDGTTCVSANADSYTANQYGTGSVKFTKVGSVGTSAITYNFKAGSDTSTFKVNGVPAGTRVFGGVMVASIIAREIKA